MLRCQVAWQHMDIRAASNANLGFLLQKNLKTLFWAKLPTSLQHGFSLLDQLFVNTDTYTPLAVKTILISYSNTNYHSML